MLAGPPSSGHPVAPDQNIPLPAEQREHAGFPSLPSTAQSPWKVHLCAAESKGWFGLFLLAISLLSLLSQAGLFAHGNSAPSQQNGWTCSCIAPEPSIRFFSPQLRFLLASCRVTVTALSDRSCCCHQDDCAAGAAGAAGVAAAVRLAQQHHCLPRSPASSTVPAAITSQRRKHPHCPQLPEQQTDPTAATLPLPYPTANKATQSHSSADWDQQESIPSLNGSFSCLTPSIKK